MQNELVYVTGQTTDGHPLIGGIWKMWEQEGLPIEVVHLKCQQEGRRIDWLEAMADAAQHNNLPALMAHLEGFFDSNTLARLKQAYVRAVLRPGVTPAQIVAAKRANSPHFRHDQTCKTPHIAS